ncbi:MAG: hypothetical protein L0271_14385 [Gemmatimonadetes bacterium]|nr:hypothetical protein [Gemmatimonadota bacterium]
MKNPQDEPGMLSRLPHDPRYWNGLAQRISRAASPHIRVWRRNAAPWWSALARHASLLAAAAAAAVILAISLLPAHSQAAQNASHTYGIAPDDPIADTLLSSADPPAVAVLLGIRTQEDER